LQCRDDGSNSALQRLKLTGRCDDRLWQAINPELDFGDDAERTFTTDIEMGEIEAGGGFRARLPVRTT
jgi:hypothetical protein